MAIQEVKFDQLETPPDGLGLALIKVPDGYVVPKGTPLSYDAKKNACVVDGAINQETMTAERLVIPFG